MRTTRTQAYGLGVCAALAAWSTVALAQTAANEPPLPGPEPPKVEVPNFFEEQPKSAPDDPIIRFSAEVFEAWVTFLPGHSTELGLATSDKSLGDYRRKSVEALIGSYKGYLERLDKIPAAEFTERGIVERETLRMHLKSAIWWLESYGAPWRDPNFYVDESIGAIQAILDGAFPVPLRRAEAALARMSLLRVYFSVARQNLETCPKPLVRRAVMRLRGSAPLFERAVPAMLRSSGHPMAQASEAGPGAAALKEALAFADWLEKEKLPKGPDTVTLGERGWASWLAAREETDLTPAQVLAAAEGDLAKLKSELATAAAKSGDTPIPAIVEGMTAELQAPDEARRASAQTANQLWDWVVRQKPLDPPSDDVILVREAPAYRRRDAAVRTFLPGPYAGKEQVAFVEIAAPDPDWPAPVVNGWLSSYGRALLPISLMREVYPGRFTAWQKMTESRIRACKAVEYPTMNEGWPLYAVDLTTLGGFGADAGRTRMAGLVGLIRADARLIAAIRIHAQGLPPADAAAWLSREGFWSRDEAAFEVEQLLADPDAPAAALGRLAIIALREDVKKAKGPSFSAREFHERLLVHGYAPVSVLRRAAFAGVAGPLVAAPK